MLTHEELIQMFPETPILLFIGEVPSTLVHCETVQILKHVGVPLYFSELLTFDSRLDTILQKAEGASLSKLNLPHSESWFDLGLFGDGILLLDGVVGEIRVLQDGRARPISSSLEKFLRTLGYLNRILSDDYAFAEDYSTQERDALYRELKGDFLTRAETIDPADFLLRMHVWRSSLDYVLGTD